MKVILFVLVFVLAGTAFAQKLPYLAPNYSKIETETKNKDSKFFHKNLLERFINNDTSFTSEEMTYLYYGYMFTDDYSPFWSSKFPSKMTLAQKQDLSNSETKELIDMCRKDLKDFPFDLYSYYILIQEYNKQADTDNLAIWQKKFGLVLDCIMSSGDGLKCESGFHVMIVAHEYVVLGVLGLNVTGQALTEGGCDLMSCTLENDESSKVDYFFNVSQMFKSYTK